MNSVYLTYSGYNCEAVLQVMETLLRNGYALMCECMLPYGADPETQAHRFICEADTVVAVITADAAECPYMVRDLAWAREADRRLLAVVVENSPLPMEVPHVIQVSEYPTSLEIASVIEAVKDSFGKECPYACDSNL